MSIEDRTPVELILDDVWYERRRQIDKWGWQRHPDDTGAIAYKVRREAFTQINDWRASRALPAEWDDILLEEVYEALSETDVAKLRKELVQVAAVCVAWIEDIDSRG